MPNPSDYNNQEDFMGACMPMMMQEGKEQEQASAACMSMWENKKTFYGMTWEEAVKHFLKIGARNSRRDAERLQQIHDYAVENGAMCKTAKDIDPEALAYFGDAVKALGNGRVGGYLVRFSDEKTPDLTGDYFSSKTNIVAPAVVPVLYQHGFDKKLGKRVLGNATTGKDDVGQWIEAQLDLRDDYEKAIYALAEKGKLGWSSGALSHLVEREAVGKAMHITSWFIGEASLTPTPAEPRNSVIPIKSIIPEAVVTDEEERQEVKSAVTPAKEKAMSEEIKAALDGFKSELLTDLKTAVKAEAETAAKAAVDQVLDQLPEVKAKMNGTVEVTVDEADRPFRSVAEQMRAIKNEAVSQGRKRHPRLKFLEEIERHEVAELPDDGSKKFWSFKEVMAFPIKAPLGMSEGVPSDAGYLLEPTLTSEIFKPIHDSGVFSKDARTLPVSGNSNYGWINGVNETSRAAGSRWGGVLGYHRAEATSVTATHPTFRRINWELKAIEVLMYATEEQLQDIAQTNAIVQQSASEELDFIVNDDIFTGNGVGMALGVMNSGPLISIARAATSQINHADLLNMWRRLAPRSRAKAKWYINSDCEGQLDRLAFTSNAGTTEMMSPYVRYTEGGVFTVKGRPVVVTEFNQSLGTAGDILLADMSEYLRWEKGGVQASVNPWLQWLTSEQAFKFTYRCDGQTAMASAVTPYHGSVTQSSFVSLSASTS